MPQSPHNKENLPKITVVTVCFNVKDEIEETILSVINQTYPNIEYIVIDGGSTDGTVDVIKKYADRIDYWVSEPDKGIYDAMNKGIDAASGDYINFMNAGDKFYDNETVKSAINLFSEKADVIYGDSISKDHDKLTFFKAGDNLNELDLKPIYRHNASFTKLTIHKDLPFDLSKSDEFKYGLDFNQIWHLFKNNKEFHHIDLPIVIFKKEGVSDNIKLNFKINYAITHQYERKGIRYKLNYWKNFNKYFFNYYKYKIITSVLK